MSQRRPATVFSLAQIRRSISALLQGCKARGGNDTVSSRRTQEQLVEVLDVPGEWTGHGSHGDVLYNAGTLRMAVRLALPRDSGVVALVRGPGDQIIIFRHQIESLAEEAGS